MCWGSVLVAFGVLGQCITAQMVAHGGSVEGGDSSPPTPWLSSDGYLSDVQDKHHGGTPCRQQLHGHAGPSVYFKNRWYCNGHKHKLTAKSLLQYKP